MSTTTAFQRAHHIARMRASFAIEGQNPDADDIVMQTRYVHGSATLADMLAYAHSFARQHAPMPGRTVSGIIGR